MTEPDFGYRATYWEEKYHSANRVVARLEERNFKWKALFKASERVGKENHFLRARVVRLKTQSGFLLGLIKDPHPGLFTWQEQITRAIAELEAELEIS